MAADLEVDYVTEDSNLHRSDHRNVDGSLLWGSSNRRPAHPFKIDPSIRTDGLHRLASALHLWQAMSHGSRSADLSQRELDRHGARPCPRQRRDMNRKLQSQTGSTVRAPSARSTSRNRVIDMERYIPTVVASLMTKLRNSAQVFFDQSYGITRLEWRIISFIAAEGPSSAYDIWTLGSLDKAAVSRAVKSLENRDLVTISAVPKDSRRRTAISLTASGRKLNDETFREIINRHQRLLAGLSDNDIEKFIAIAKHLEKRIPEMDNASCTKLSKFDPTKSPSQPRSKKKRPSNL